MLKKARQKFPPSLQRMRGGPKARQKIPSRVPYAFKLFRWPMLKKVAARRRRGKKEKKKRIKQGDVRPSTDRDKRVAVRMVSGWLMRPWSDLNSPCLAIRSKCTCCRRRWACARPAPGSPRSRWGRPRTWPPASAGTPGPWCRRPRWAAAGR